MRQQVGSSIGIITAAVFATAACASTPQVSAAPVERPAAALAEAPAPSAATSPAEKAQDAGAVDPSVAECAVACRGMGGADLAQEVRARAAVASHCYNEALAIDRTLRGRVTVLVRVSTTGQVCAVNPVANETGSAALASCMMRSFQSRFGAVPRDGCIDINIPFAFSTTDAGAPAPARP